MQILPQRHPYSLIAQCEPCGAIRRAMGLIEVKGFAVLTRSALLARWFRHSRLFRFSSMLTVIWRALLLRKHAFRRRLPASMVMVLGAVLLTA